MRLGRLGQFYIGEKLGVYSIVPQLELALDSERSGFVFVKQTPENHFL